MGMRIPILDLAPEIKKHRAEFQDAIERVLLSAEFIQGTETKLFEKEVAAYLGVKHAIGLNSGTDGLVIGLRALGVGPGDQVITTAFTFYATAEAISLVGAEPVFVDIEPGTFNLDPVQVESQITERTKAIIPVHLFGQTAHLAPLLALADRHGIPLLEDTAQAFGADYHGKKLGTLGDLGTFSFFPSKNLGAFGDGGLIVTDDDSLAETCRMLGNHGSKRRYYNEMLGYNSRLDSIQAAVLRTKLKYVDGMNQSRRDVAQRYHELLAGTPGIATPVESEHGTHVYHQYTVRLSGGIRDRVVAHMADEGVSTMVYYPIAVPNLKVYSLDIRLPHSERACAEVLSLPIWPEMDLAVQERVAEVLKRAVITSRFEADPPPEVIAPESPTARN